MSDPVLTHTLERRDYCLLAAFCFVLFGLSMVSGRPLSVHEAVLPQSAREMLADKDWVVPKKGGTPWLESPPLPQWVTVGLASLFGRCDEVWIVRLGPTLMATAVVLMVAWMAGCWFGRTMGLLSGFVMATTCQFARYAWLAEDEIFLCSLVTAAVALFVRLEFPRTRKSESSEFVGRTILSDERTDGQDCPSHGIIEHGDGQDCPSHGIIEQGDGQDCSSHGGTESTGSGGGLLRSFVGSRSWWVALFFVVLGMTNLAKGLLFGAVMALVPIAGFLLWNADLRRISRYIWLPGWLIFAVVMFAWPAAAYLRYPDVLELWNYDLGGRLDGSYVEITEPIWYYPVNLLWMLAPWTIVVPFGLWTTRQRAFKERYSPERFLWCWAILVPVVFSLPQGKHHHYLLHGLTPWAVLSAFGLVKLREQMLNWSAFLRNPFTSLLTTALPAIAVIWLLRSKIPGPDWLPTAVIVACPFLMVVLSWALLHRNDRLAARTLFASLAVAYGFGHWFAGVYADQHRHDAAFLARVRQTVPANEPLLVDMNVQPLRGFFCLFYLDENTKPLHNLSFALDERIARDEVYLLTWFGQRAVIEEFGTYKVVMQTERAGRERSVDERLTLFRVKYRPDVQRVSAEGVRVSPMQAIYRTHGPSLARF